MIKKPFDQITGEDIEALCSHGGVYESQTLEYKRELSGKNGRPDPWMESGDFFTEQARDHLFREIVAFANAQGGTVVVGIEETKDNPPRAARVAPVPRVHDLAARLEQAAQACIEPTLGGLRIRGITIGGADAGVVVLRTPASPLGPHRIRRDGHAYIRRGPHSVPMTMREIQDLTLDLARGADRLETQFRERDTAFTTWLRRSRSKQVAGFRVSASPLGGLPQRIRVAAVADRFDFQKEFVAEDENGKQYRLLIPIYGHNGRPILRGYRFSNDDSDLSFLVEVLDNGVIDFWFRHAIENGVHLYSWLADPFSSNAEPILI